MAQTTVLQSSFRRGMRRDRSRHEIPTDACWNLIDYIPDILGAPLEKRGGYGYQSNDISAVTATASYVIGGIYAPYSGGAKNQAIDEDGRLYTIAANGTVTDVGAAVVVAQNPVFHRNRIIIPASSGAAVPKTYDGTTLANLGGSPPNGIYACVYKDRTVLARSSANLERLWFSDPGDPQLWDTTNTYWDGSYPVTGLFALRNAILLFSESRTERLRGSIPPPGSDFILDPLFETGCTDARSIAAWGDNVIFANPGGVFITDGSALDDLTATCGMKSYWQDTIAGYDSSSWTLVGGVLRDYYIIAVMNGSTFVDAAMIDLARRSWIRLANWKARAMWRALAADEELYFGLRSAARVARTSDILEPTASNKNDADGTAVTPVLETPYFSDRFTRKTWRFLYPSYDLRDAASDNPTITVSTQRTIEGSYTALSPTLAETSDQDTPKRTLGFPASGLALRLAQSGASSATRIYALEAVVHTSEPSRKVRSA